MIPPDATVYAGERLIGPRGQHLGVLVTKHGRPLDPGPSQHKIRNHSPSGYEWGYGGSGPAQLAAALVLDATGDLELAAQCYQWFKWAIVNCWTGHTWSITAGEVRAWVRQWEAETAAEAERTVHRTVYLTPADQEGGAP